MIQTYFISAPHSAGVMESVDVTDPVMEPGDVIEEQVTHLASNNIYGRLLGDHKNIKPDRI